MLTYLSKYFVEIKDIDTSKINISFVTKEESYVNGGTDVVIFWGLYEDMLLYAVTDYELSPFETFYDWDPFFNFLEPTRDELERLLKYNIKYYIVKYDIFLDKSIRDSICQWEMDIISKWNREQKINELLDGKTA